MSDVMLDDRPLVFDDLVGYFAAGEKPESAWRVGAEHEKFGFKLHTYDRPPYEGPWGIKAMLNGLERFGWKGVLRGRDPDRPVARHGQHQPRARAASFEALRRAARNHPRHLFGDRPPPGRGEDRRRRDRHRVPGRGLRPVIYDARRIPIMPKGRYDIMRAYMPKVGTLGLDMMLRTCTIKANLDFSTEADMVMKFRTSPWRCSRSPRPCSPTHPSPKASPTGS